MQGAAITNPLQIPHAACLLQGPGLQLPDAVAVPLSAGTAGILLSFVLSPAEMVKVGAGVGGWSRTLHHQQQQHGAMRCAHVALRCLESF